MIQPQLHPVTTVVLADDHTTVRMALKTFIELDGSIQVVGEATDGREAVEVTAETRPDVAIIDIGMPRMNGIEAARRIHAKNPDQKILFFTMHSDDERILQALKTKPLGYVLKDAKDSELLQAIRDVADGETHFSGKVAQVLVQGYMGKRRLDDAYDTLTVREREIFQMIAEGQSNREIAEALGLAKTSIETHRRNLMAKLDIHNMAELMRYAIRKRVVE